MMDCRKTQLYDFHKERGHIVEFAGFCMPLYYTSIIKEHMAVRTTVGMFDVSHMGRLMLKGRDAKEFLNYITANDVNKLKPGKAQYTLFLNRNGGIIDDLIIYMLDEETYLAVVNAGNREKDLKWVDENIRKGDFDVDILNISDNSLMLAVQGPEAVNIVKEKFPETQHLKRFNFLMSNYGNNDILISRTGYTGEDGFELILFSNDRNTIYNLWESLYEDIERKKGAICGLGARDSLRIEAGYCLYGNDIDDNTNPFEAGLSWVVKMYKKDFIGKDALLRITEENLIKRVRIGVVLESKAIPRKGYKVYTDTREIGFITSGTFSPILNKGIGMGYIDKYYAQEGLEVYVDIRGKMYRGTIKKFPLYDPTKYGYTRER